MHKEEGEGLGFLRLKVSNVFFSMPPLVCFECHGEKFWEDRFVQSIQKRLAVTITATPRTEYLFAEQLLCNHLQHKGV